MADLWLPDGPGGWQKFRKRTPADARRAPTRDREVISICRVPVNAEGRVCGKRFYTGEEKAAEVHTVRCARRHTDAIMAFRERSHPSIMKPWDPEYAAWLAQHKQAVLEGRMRA